MAATTRGKAKSDGPAAQGAAGDLAILSVDALLAADDLPEKTVPVPAWGGSVRLRALTHGQFVDAQTAATVNGEVDNTRFDMEVLFATLVEPKLTRDQLGQLSRKNYAVVQTLVREAAVLVFSDPEKVAARFREESGGGVRVPVGEGAGDDGDAAAAGDA